MSRRLALIFVDAKQFICLIFPSRTNSNINLPIQLDLDHVSPATRLLEKQRQMTDVQSELDLQKEEYMRREEAFKRREDQLRKKDLELQESLIRFNKFLKVRVLVFRRFRGCSTAENDLSF